MDIVISVGIKNICVARRHEDLKFELNLGHLEESSRQGLTTLNASDIYRSINILHFDKLEKDDYRSNPNK